MPIRLIATALLAVLLLLISTGCASLENLRRAARDLGAAQAQVNLPETPAICNEDVPHAPLVPGEDSLHTLKRERFQLDKANATRRICVREFSEKLRQDFSAGSSVP